MPSGKPLKLREKPDVNIALGTADALNRDDEPGGRAGVASVKKSTKASDSGQIEIGETGEHPSR